MIAGLRLFRWPLAVLAAAAIALAACSGAEEPPPAPQIQEDGEDREAAEEPQQEEPSQEQQAQPEQEAREQEEAPGEPEEAVIPGTRAITLFGDLTEVVYALGAQEFLVARDTASIYPPEAEALPNLGFNQALSAEAVLAYSPTIVFATPAAGPAAAIDHLRDAGVEVVVIDEDDDFDAPGAKIRTVGAALGIPGRAEALALETERRIAETRDSIDDSDRGPEVLFLYLRGPFQFAGGADSVSQLMIEAAGGIDAGAAAGIVGWQLLTPEAVVAADPQVLLLMEGGVESVGGIDGLLRIPGIAETRAGQNRRFVIMDDLYLLDFGPRTPDALADLAAELRRLRREIDGG